jgi:hypothetical protein
MPAATSLLATPATSAPTNPAPYAGNIRKIKRHVNDVQLGSTKGFHFRLFEYGQDFCLKIRGVSTIVRGYEAE